MIGPESRTPRREPAWRMGTPDNGVGACSPGPATWPPQLSPCPRKQARRLGAMGRGGESWPSLVPTQLPSSSLEASQRGASTSQAQGPPPQPLTRATVRPRRPPPAESHLGQQDQELLLAQGLGAPGTHAPLGRHGPAAPGLTDLPLLPDQATGQRSHGSPGDTPKPAGALGSP